MTTTLLAETTAAATTVWLDSWIGGGLGGTPTGWALPGYDDSAWDAPLQSDAPCAPAKWIYPQEAFDETRLQGLIWLARTTFTLAEVPTEAFLLCANDDSATYYINGTNVRSAGLSLDCATERQFDPSLLLVGENVLAVRVTNSAASPYWSGPPPNSTSVTARAFSREPDEPVEAVGWDVYSGADPTGDILATLTHATERSIRIELDGTGSGTFTINRYADEATAAVLAKGNIVKVRYPEIGTDYIFAFILEAGDFTLVSSSETGGEMLSFGGRGILAYLDRAIMWNEAFTTGLDVSDTWLELWETSAVSAPSGTAFVAAESGFIYAIGMRTRRIYKIDQTTRAVVSSSPVLWADSTHYAAGLAVDPSDSTIFWVLEAPWLSGSADHTRIRKIRKSDWATTANFALGSAIKHTAIKADASNLWLTRYDGSTTIYKRSKSDGSVVSSYSVSYGGVTQTKANGISVNGTDLAYWYSGTKRALLATTAAPTTITGKISTQTISAFGGEWTTEGGNDYFYMDSYSAGLIWKYQLTSATPHDPVDGIWRLDEGTPGAILARLMAEWQAVGRPQQPIPDVTYAFDYTDDSNGNTWAAHDGTLQFDARVRDGGLDTALRLIPYGLKLQMSPYLELGAYNSFGTNRSNAIFAAGKVRFVKGVNIADELRRRLDERTVHSHMLAEGDGLYATATDNDFGYVREGGIGTQLDDATALEGTAEVELARERLVADAIAFAVTWADDELAGGYLPGPAGTNGHYWVGDVIRLHTGSGEFDYDEQSVTVYAITLTEEDNGDWKPLVELRTGFIPELAAFFETGSVGGGTSNGASSGTTSTVVTGSKLTVTDGEIDIPQVTRIEYEGAYSPAPGTAVLPRGSTGAGLAEDLLTDESDATLVLAPDGLGGVEFRAGTATFGTPAIVLGTAAAAGAVDEAIRRDSTIVAFDATNPSTQAFGDAAAAGVAAVAARRDHKHAMPAGATSVAADATANTDLAANALTDITGCSISLTAGTWEIDGWITFDAIGSYALLVIADASNTTVAEMRGLTSVTAETTWPVSARVTPASTTTYKLRAQTDGNPTALRLGAGNAVGTRIRAIKVG